MGLEQLPLREVAYRGHTLKEFDLDPALTRQPDVLLVDELGEAAVQRNFGGQELVMATDAHDQLVLPAQGPEGFDASVADWAFRNEQPAGLATTTLSAQDWHYVPLKAPMRIRGVLALQPAQPRWLLIPEKRQQLDTLGRQIAIALEWVHYVDIAQQAVVQMESERLRNTLLAAISPDVRTPLTALIGLGNTVVQTDVLTGLPLVEFDAVLIERVLVNLLENAVKYGKPPIVLSARADMQTLVLSVRDHGLGLPVELLGSASALPGVGLGLAICKAVVDAHGGQISAGNASWGGAEFTVTLPRREPPAVTEALPESA